MIHRIVMKTQPKELSRVSFAGVRFASPLTDRKILRIAKISKDRPTGTPMMTARAMTKSSIISPMTYRLEHSEYHSLSTCAQKERPWDVCSQSNALPKKHSSPPIISHSTASSLYPGSWLPKASSNSLTHPLSSRKRRNLR